MRITFPGLSIDGSKIIETLEEAPVETFLQLKKKFKTEFVRWEDLITKGKNPKYNIVFIDDLDRCEPENVLNLLSALKLFFTYGEKTIFFCGVDKKAINEAVRTKYGKVVKANEYLEKIFDISFTMPEHENLLKLVSVYFEDKDVSNRVSIFLKDLDFTNPRRVKKMFNKFYILRNIRKSSKKGNYIGLMPDFYFEGSGNYLETILTLYFIILHEFFPSKYRDLFDFKKKEANFYKAFQGSNIETQRVQISQRINKNIIQQPFYTILDDTPDRNFEHYSLALLPCDADSLTSSSFKKDQFHTFKVKKKEIEYRFVLHLYNNNVFDIKNGFSECTLIGLKKMVRNII